MMENLPDKIWSKNPSRKISKLILYLMFVLLTQIQAQASSFVPPEQPWDCQIQMPNSYIPTQTYIDGQKYINVTISTIDDPIWFSGSAAACDIAQNPNPTLYYTLYSTYQKYIDPLYLVNADYDSLSATEQGYLTPILTTVNVLSNTYYSNGALIITINVQNLTPGQGNYALYLGVSMDNFQTSGVNSVIAAWTPIRANYVCFTLFEYMNSNLDVYVQQDNFCVEIVCQLQFSMPFQSIVMPAVSASSTVTTASSANPINPVNQIFQDQPGETRRGFCDYNYQYYVYAVQQDGTVPSTNFATIKTSQTATTASTGNNNNQFGSAFIETRQLITNLQIQISPALVTDNYDTAVYVQVYDSRSNLATGWQCFMVYADATVGYSNNFCQDYCTQFTTVYPSSSLMQQNLGSYQVSEQVPQTQIVPWLGFRTLQAFGCPLTHSITCTNAIALTSVIFTQPTRGIFKIQTLGNLWQVPNDDGSVYSYPITGAQQIAYFNAGSLYNPTSVTANFVFSVIATNAIAPLFTRNFQISYTGCLSSPIINNGPSTWNVPFYVDQTNPQNQQQTFWPAFGTSISACSIVLSDNQSGLTNPYVFSPKADYINEQSPAYFNITLNSATASSYAGKTESFVLYANHQDSTSPVTITVNIEFKTCGGNKLPNCKFCNNNPLNQTWYNVAIQFGTIGCQVCMPGFTPYLFQDPVSLIIVRGCQVAQSPPAIFAQADWGKLFLTTLLLKTDCNAIYQNCMLCSGMGTCLQCDSGFIMSTFQYPKPYNMCMKNIQFGGVITASPNCLQYNYATQQCLNCVQTYQLSLAGTCVLSSARRLQSAPINLFVQSFEGNINNLNPLLIPQIANANLNSASTIGQSMASPYVFLIHAINYINSGMFGQASVNGQLTVNIWIQNGLHHYFTCPSALNAQDFCTFNSALNMAQTASFTYPVYNNINIIVQPLDCNLQKAQFQQQTGFSQWCVDTTNPNLKPIVQIDGSNNIKAYFNITNYATFNFIRFTGLNQLAIPVPANTAQAQYNPQTICRLKGDATCGLPTTCIGLPNPCGPSGPYQPLQLVSCDPNFQCVDSNFNNQVMTTPVCLTELVINDRPDSSQPFQQNYFQQDTTQSFYTSRIKTLFNLYAFSSLQSNIPRIPALTITNCEFEFFLDYTSLVFVETVQFTFWNNFFVKQGQDKGVNFQMTGTTIRNSRFMRGAIYYKYDEYTRNINPNTTTLFQQNQIQMKFLYFEEQASVQQVAITDINQVLIQNCNFTNLNYGRVEMGLVLDNILYRNITSPFNIPLTPQTFTTYNSNGVGLAINLQGFQGTIAINNNLFQLNIFAFYPQISKMWDVIQMNGMFIDNLYNDDLYTYQLFQCNNYLFNDVFTSYTLMNDQLIFKMQAMSTVLIALNELPAIFTGNTFSNNVGFMGGAILIDSQNNAANQKYLLTYTTPQIRPVIVISNNTFTRNMAYSSGNAIYIRGVQLSTTSNVCAGVHLQLNNFTQNLAVTKTHNGGAITLACDVIDMTDLKRFPAYSEVQIGNVTNQTIAVQDYITPSMQYQTYLYGYGVVNNTFQENTSGQKGSAIYTRNLNTLFIVNNTLIRNQPMYSFLESTFLSPLWVYYFQMNRLATWTPFLIGSINVTNEFVYFQQRQVQSQFVELPQLQGAIYIESCQTCYVTFVIFDCQLCRELVFYNQITNNTFIDNQAGINFYEQQQSIRSSQIQIFGGNLFNIESNFFNNIQSIYQSLVQTMIPDFYNSLPTNYFFYQNSPLIKVIIPTLPWYQTSIVNFQYNQFVNNTGYQSFLNQDSYNGFLIDFDGTQELNSTLNFNANIVKYCRVYGTGVSLIAAIGNVNGTNNIFFRIGQLNQTIFSPGQTTALFLPPSLQNSYSQSTELGVFQITQPTFIAQQQYIPVNHTFSGNQFQNLFCKLACVYSFNNNMFTHSVVTLIYQNTYMDILGVKSAIAQTIVSQFANITYYNQNNVPYVVQIFVNETFTDVQNELFFLQGGLNTFQIFNNIQSLNVFGQIPLISLTTTDAFFMASSDFLFETQWQNRFVVLSTSIQNVYQTGGMWNLDIIQVWETQLQNYYNDTYYDQATQNLFLAIQQNNGVLSITNNQIAITNQTVFWYLNTTQVQNNTVYQYIQTQFQLNTTVSTTISSTIVNSTFVGHQGWDVSVLSSTNSILLLNNTRFTYNSAVGQFGTNVAIYGGNFTGLWLIFGNNQANQGAGISIMEYANVFIANSSFSQNNALQEGGGVYCENSGVVLNNCTFSGNTAVFNSGIAANQCLEYPFQVINSAFVNNNAEKGLVGLINSQMIITDSIFMNNQANVVSSGIILDSSIVIAININVTNSQVYSNSSIVSGFLLLASSSQVTIMDSSFSMLWGTQAAVIMAQGQSKLYLENTTFSNNQVSQLNTLGQTGTIVASQCVSITLVNCTFDNNNNINVNSDTTVLIISGSIFQNLNTLTSSFVQIYGQSLQISNSQFLNSASTLAQGTAIYASNLPSLQITGSVFQNLTSYQGGAIYVQNSMNSKIVSNFFYSNQASQGGGLYIMNSTAQVTTNFFLLNSGLKANQTNKSKGTSLSEGAGGGIYFTCVDQLQGQVSYQMLTQQQQNMCGVLLNGNVFNNNTATNKGGAVFFANKNFTMGPNQNTFNNNSANYGNIFSSFPNSLNMNFLPSPNVQISPGMNALFPQRRLQIASQQDTYYLNICSGGAFQYSASIFDLTGNSYVDDNISTAQFVFANSSAISSNEYIINGQAIAVAGVYQFNNVMVILKPGTWSIINIQVNQLSDYGNTIGFIQMPVQFYVSSRPCTGGEKYTPQFTCVWCPTGSYLLQNQTEPGQCQPCFPNAICFGGNIVAPNMGYYRFDVMSSEVYQCPNFDACFGGNQTNLTGSCALGYQGAYCAQCFSGYYQRDDAFVCMLCHNIWLEVFFYILSWAFCIGIIVWIQKQFINNFVSENNTTLTVFKILITNMQIIMMITKIGVFNESDFIQRYLYALSVPIEVFLRIIFPKCLLQQISDQETLFYAEVALLAVLPFFIFGFSFFFWKCKNIKTLDDKFEAERKVLSRTMSTMNIIYYIYYPFILESVLSAVSCQSSSQYNLDQNFGGEVYPAQRLIQQPNIVCFQGTHSWFTWVVSIPAIFTWVIGFPFLLLWLMVKKNQNLIVKNCVNIERVRADDDAKQDDEKKNSKIEHNDSLNNETKEHQVTPMDISAAKSIYGFLFIGFKLCIDKKDIQKNVNSGAGLSEGSFKEMYDKVSVWIQPITIGLEINDPYSAKLKKKVHTYYYWEIVIYLRKIIVTILVIQGRSIQSAVQLNCIIVTLAIFGYLQMKNRPYISDRMNLLEILSIMICLSFVYVKMALLSQELNMENVQQTINMYSDINQSTYEDSLMPSIQQTQNQVSFLQVATQLIVVIVSVIFWAMCLNELRNQLLTYLSRNLSDNNNRLYKIFSFGGDPAKHQENSILSNPKQNDQPENVDSIKDSDMSQLENEKDNIQYDQEHVIFTDERDKINGGKKYEASEKDVSEIELMSDSDMKMKDEQNNIRTLKHHPSVRKYLRLITILEQKNKVTQGKGSVALIKAKPMIEDSVSHVSSRQEIQNYKRATMGQQKDGSYSESEQSSRSEIQKYKRATTMKQPKEPQSQKDGGSESQDIEVDKLSPAVQRAGKKQIVDNIQKKNQFGRGDSQPIQKKLDRGGVHKSLEYSGSMSSQFTWEDATEEKKNNTVFSQTNREANAMQTNYQQASEFKKKKQGVSHTSLETEN